MIPFPAAAISIGKCFKKNKFKPAKFMDTCANVPGINSPKAWPETLTELALQTEAKATAGDRRTDYVLIVMHHHQGNHNYNHCPAVIKLALGRLFGL